MALNGFDWVHLLSEITSRNWLLLFCFCVDTKKDLRMITMRLLDMLVSKNVSGQGRDQALNLLNKNIPRKDLKDHDNSRSIFVIDNGKSFPAILLWVGGCGAVCSCLNTWRTGPTYKINPLWLFWCMQDLLAGNSTKRKSTVYKNKNFWVSKGLPNISG